MLKYCSYHFFLLLQRKLSQVLVNIQFSLCTLVFTIQVSATDGLDCGVWRKQCLFVQRRQLLAWLAGWRLCFSTPFTDTSVSVSHNTSNVLLKPICLYVAIVGGFLKETWCSATCYGCFQIRITWDFELVHVGSVVWGLRWGLGKNGQTLLGLSKSPRDLS